MEEPTKPKRGRKPIDEPVHNLAIRMKESDYQFLSGVAHQNGKTISAYLRDLVEQDKKRSSNHSTVTVKTKNNIYMVYTDDIAEVIYKLSKSLTEVQHANT